MRMSLVLSLLTVFALAGCRHGSGPTQTFNTYGANEELTAVEAVGRVEIDMTLPMEERLQILADSISSPGWFKVRGVQSQNQLEVANIELTDPTAAPADQPLATPWYMKFQGSTGSYLTSEKIEKTLGQTLGMDGWPDAVRYLYRGWLGSHADDVFVYARIDEAGEVIDKTAGVYE